VRVIIGNEKIEVEDDIIQIEDVDNKTLTEEILSNKNRRLDWNPLQSRYEDTELLPTTASKKLLFKIDTSVKLNVNPLLKGEEVWSHILEPNQSTMYHDHKEERDGVSFVYYVTYPEDSGNLVFEFDVLGKRVFRSIRPKVGELILFPTYIPHFTTRNVSDEIRISISGNYFPMNR
tara:strand:+ start:422 stop:949 length:528 start_codon:yes stop_codon:yes gene_type:complete